VLAATRKLNAVRGNPAQFNRHANNRVLFRAANTRGYPTVVSCVRQKMVRRDFSSGNAAFSKGSVALIRMIRAARGWGISKRNLESSGREAPTSNFRCHPRPTNPLQRIGGGRPQSLHGPGGRFGAGGDCSRFREFAQNIPSLVRVIGYIRPLVFKSWNMGDGRQQKTAKGGLLVRSGHPQAIKRLGVLPGSRRKLSATAAHIVP